LRACSIATSARTWRTWTFTIMGAIGDDYQGGKSDELLDLAWTLLLQEWETLKKCCQINARKSRGRDTWEEAMSLLAAHLPDDVLGWDPSMGKSLRSHVIGNARWRLYKEFVTRRRLREGREQLMSKFATDDGDDADWGDESVGRRGESASSADGASLDELAHDDVDEVRYVLDEVGRSAETLLTMRFAAGLTYDEMAGVLGCSKSMAYRLTQVALASARETADRSSACRDAPRAGCLCRLGLGERCVTHAEPGTSASSTPIAHLIATTLAGVMGTSVECETRSPGSWGRRSGADGGRSGAGDTARST
jgi:DNA-directed RNA polymerase specialized sigma24 family protein